VDLLEPCAVVVSVLAVVLTARRSLWNFPLALASVGMYAVIFYRVRLYADAVLQCVFAITLLYGIAQWRRSRSEDGEVKVRRIDRRTAQWSVLAIAAITAIFGLVLDRATDAALPWIDSGLLGASLVGSVWAARRLLEQWLLWCAVDVAYACVYLYKALYPTALLYAVFIVLALYGWQRWRRAWFAGAGTAEPVLLAGELVRRSA
jgi:nicotinamide mononucleotide transporter